MFDVIRKRTKKLYRMNCRRHHSPVERENSGADAARSDIYANHEFVINTVLNVLRFHKLFACRIARLYPFFVKMRVLDCLYALKFSLLVFDSRISVGEITV